MGEALRRALLTGVQVVQLSAGFCILGLKVLMCFRLWKSKVVNNHPVVPVILFCGVSRWLRYRRWCDRIILKAEAICFLSLRRKKKRKKKKRRNSLEVD